MKKYFGKFVPKKSWFDTNNDGDIDYKDFLKAAKNALDALTPSSSILDINGDGKVDVNDALDAARITGATIAGAGITVAASSYAGTILISGKATAIATTIAASIGAGFAGGVTTLLGSTTTIGWAAWQTTSGAWIVAAKSVTSISPALISTISGAGAIVPSTVSGVIETIAGFPVIQAIATDALVSSGDILMVVGIPIAREVAIAAGLIALVIIGGYSYYILTRHHITKQEIETTLSPNPF